MTGVLVFANLRAEAVEVRLLAHHIQMLTGIKYLRVRILFQDDRQGIQQDFHAFFGGEACDHANDRTPLPDVMFRCENLNRLRRWNRHFDGRQDRGQFGGVAREVGGMVGVVLCIGHDVIRQNPRHVVLEVHDGVDEAVEETGGKLQVAVIGEDGGLAEETSAQGDAGRVELGQMELDDVVPGNEFGGDPAEGGRDDALADARRDGDADDFDAVHCFLERKRRVVLCGHHGDLVSAFGKGAREALGVDGEARGVRAVVGEYGQDFHERGDYIRSRDGMKVCMVERFLKDKIHRFVSHFKVMSFRSRASG